MAQTRIDGLFAVGFFLPPLDRSSLWMCYRQRDLPPRPSVPLQMLWEQECKPWSLHDRLSSCFASRGPKMVASLPWVSVSPNERIWTNVFGAFTRNGIHWDHEKWLVSADPAKEVGTQKIGRASPPMLVKYVNKATQTHWKPEERTQGESHAKGQVASSDYVGSLVSLCPFQWHLSVGPHWESWPPSAL
jgi:hypothetical protein